MKNNKASIIERIAICEQIIDKLLSELHKETPLSCNTNYMFFRLKAEQFLLRYKGITLDTFREEEKYYVANSIWSFKHDLIIELGTLVYNTEQNEESKSSFF